MKAHKIVLVGGSGFLGSAIANRLSEAGAELLIPTRRIHHARDLLLLPTARIVEADVYADGVLEQLCAGADAIINLVGILHSREGSPWGADFERAHVALPKRIVAAAQSAGVRQLIHVSALGASEDAPSAYLRSKAAGEAAVRAAGDTLDWTLLRPSVVFGRGDSFLNLFASLLRVFPILPLAGAKARFQPVYVEDIAEIVHRILDTHRESSLHQCFELAGPSIYTLQELVETVGDLIGKRRPVLPLPNGLAMLQARLMELAPQPLMSRDNLRSMQRDNVASGPALPLSLSPTSLEAVAPLYLGNAAQRLSYYPMRRHARRSST